MAFKLCKLLSLPNRVFRMPKPLLLVSASVSLIVLGVAYLQSDKPKTPRSKLQATAVKPQVAAKVVPAPKQLSQEEVAKRQWLNVAGTLRQADQRRSTAFTTNVNLTRNLASSLVTEQGIDAFIEDALSLKSKAMSLKDQAEHRQWLENLFTTYVFPVNDFKNIMVQQSRSLESVLGQIDNETLIAIQADVELDPSKLQVDAIDVSALNRQLDALVDDIHDTVNQSTARSISSFFFGMAGFEAGRQLSRNAMKDDQGEVSILGELVSWGIGFAAEEVTRAVSDEVLQIRETIDADLRRATRELLDRCTVDGPIHRERFAALSRHQVATFKAVTESLGVDPQWAITNMSR